METIAADVAEHWPVYLAIPLVAALIGYLTKRAAIEMMFRPMQFVGVGRYLGWQGVVPRYGPRMAAIAAELLTSKLIDPKEVFARVDADRVTREVEQPLLVAIDHIARDVLAEHHPATWEALPALAQDMVVKQIQVAAPRIVRQIADDLRDNVDSVIDIKQLVIERLANDRPTLVRIIRDLSRPDMDFIARAGIWSGFALGLAQSVVWAVTKQPLVMPVFGAAIGFLTDWLAIRMVFQPREPIVVAGVLTVHGSFHRRRAAVAKQYGEIIAAEVLTPQNLLTALLRGPRSDRVIELVERTVTAVVEQQAGPFRPLVSATIGPGRMAEMKRAAAAAAVTRMPAASRGAHGYLADAMAVADLVEERILRLSPEEYEELLRPAIKQDEWKLITVGGVIGALIGELQVLLMLG